ncbi:MAG: hydroxyacid dehydrogenase [Nitrososphaerota archaeon]
MKILVCDQLADEAISMMKQSGLDVTYEPRIMRERLLEDVDNYDAIVVRSRTKVDRTVIDAAKKLRVIARAGVGLDNIDVEAAKERGIEVLNSPESLTNAAAEHTLALLLASARNIGYSHLKVVSGEWPKEKSMGIELTGKTFGIVGFGRIGRRLAQLLKPFNPRILVYDIIRPPDELLVESGAELTTLENLLKESDFVSLHVPLTQDTSKMIDSTKLSMMKSTAVIVNTSRGGIIDEEALVTALKTGKIRAAGLDVFSSEPPKNKELFSLENVVLTPHIAGQTLEAQLAAGKSIAEKLINFFNK